VIALRLLTIIPLGKKIDLKGGNLASSTIFFPLVGIIIGGFLVLINIITSFLPSFIRNVLIMIGWIWITGALHLDGFVDTMDGFAAGEKREEIFLLV